jgi:hypothetical protein
MKAAMRVVAIAGLLCASAVVGVVAQNPQLDESQSGVVKTGEYRDLTFLRNLKLGTAPYVNPRLLKTSEVAYKYDAGVVAAAADFATLWDALKSGEIALARVTDDEYYWVISAADPISEQKLKDLMTQASQHSAKEYVFVSAAEAYKGMQNSGAVVTWQAGAPVRPTTVGKGSEAATPGGDGNGW